MLIEFFSTLFQIFISVLSYILNNGFHTTTLCLRTLNEVNVGQQVPNGGGHLKWGCYWSCNVICTYMMCSLAVCIIKNMLHAL